MRPRIWSPSMSRAFFVGHHHAIGVAVERDTEIGAPLAHLALHGLGKGRAAFIVDVEAVRRVADGDHFGAQLPKHRGRHLVGRAVRAIDDDAQAVETQLLRKGALRKFDVAGLRVVDALGAADLARLGKTLFEPLLHQRFDLHFAFVGQLLSVGAEKLDAVVFELIVRRGNHHAQIRAQRTREHGHGRRRQRAEQEHIHAHGGEARHQRGLDHIAGQPRVLADHDAMAMVAAGEDAAGGHAGFQGDFRRHRVAVGPSAYAVGPEQLAGHEVICPWMPSGTDYSRNPNGFRMARTLGLIRGRGSRS
jgi:hypothetical protein